MVNSKAFIAVVTGPCTNVDAPHEPPEQNAYFKRWACVKELRWAREVGVPIQPVLRVEDRQRKGEFLMMAPADLQDLGRANWVDLGRNDHEYWRVGIEKVLDGIELIRRRNPKAKL